MTGVGAVSSGGLCPQTLHHFLARCLRRGEMDQARLPTAEMKSLGGQLTKTRPDSVRGPSNKRPQKHNGQKERTVGRGTRKFELFKIRCCQELRGPGERCSQEARGIVKVSQSTRPGSRQQRAVTWPGATLPVSLPPRPQSSPAAVTSGYSGPQERLGGGCGYGVEPLASGERNWPPTDGDSSVSLAWGHFASLGRRGGLRGPRDEHFPVNRLLGRRICYEPSTKQPAG